MKRLGTIYFSTKSSGTGLGLTFSYQVIHAIGSLVSGPARRKEVQSLPSLSPCTAPNQKKLLTDRSMDREQQKARLRVSPGGSIVKPLDFNINHNAIKSSYAPNKGRAGMMLRIGFIRVKSRPILETNFQHNLVPLISV